MSLIRTIVSTGATVGVTAGLCLGLTACGASSSAESTASSGATTATTPAAAITISQAWVRTTEGAMSPDMTAAFLTIQNSTASSVSIQSVTSEVAGKVELHEMVMKDGKMVMQPKANGITVPAGGTTVLKPGGDHVMLMQLKKALAVGSEVSFVVTFSDGTTKTVTAPVKKFADGNAQYVTPTVSSSMPITSSMSATSSMSSTPSMPASTTQPGGGMTP